MLHLQQLTFATFSLFQSPKSLEKRKLPAKTTDSFSD